MQRRFMRNHGVAEGDHFPSLKSHRKVLEQESGFPGVFCDCGDLLCQLCHRLMPHTRRFHSKRMLLLLLLLLLSLCVSNGFF